MVVEEYEASLICISGLIFQNHPQT